MFSNPGNPTGTILPIDQIERLIENTPPHILIVIDGAYAEYCTDTDFDSAERLVKKHNNVIITRTFSKAYGLANIRLGWCYANADIIATINRMRIVFNTSLPAQLTGITALQDQEFITTSVEHNTKWLAILSDAFTAQGFTVPTSHANFILVDFATDSKALSAYKYFKKKGIIVRNVKSYGLPSCLRITVGNEWENQQLLNALNGMDL